MPFRVLDLTDSAAIPSAELMDVTVLWTELGFLDQESADESQEINTSNDVNLCSSMGRSPRVFSDASSNILLMARSTLRWPLPKPCSLRTPSSINSKEPRGHFKTNKKQQQKKLQEHYGITRRTFKTKILIQDIGLIIWGRSMLECRGRRKSRSST